MVSKKKAETVNEKVKVEEVDLPDKGEKTGRTVTVMATMRFSAPVPANKRTPNEKQAYAYKLLQDMVSVLNAKSEINIELTGIPTQFIV